MKALLKAKSEFRKKGVVLIADKVKQGGGGSWKFAGEDNLIKTIQAPLSECNLEIFTKIQYNESAGSDEISVTLYHTESGEFIETSITMPTIEAKKDKNLNPMYLDAEIERGKQFGYWARTLTIRILGISDIDPEDMNNRPEDLTGDAKEQREKLTKLVEETPDSKATIAWILKTYKVSALVNLTIAQIKNIIITIEQKQKKK